MMLKLRTINKFFDPFGLVVYFVVDDTPDLDNGNAISIGWRGLRGSERRRMWNEKWGIR